MLGLTISASSGSFTLANLSHDRLGHIGKKSLNSLQLKGVFGKLNLGDFGSCERCVIGKQVKLLFTIGIHKSKQVLEYLHTDLWGLTAVCTLFGFKYFLLVIDDFSKKYWVFILKKQR